MLWLRTLKWCSLISIATWNRQHLGLTNIIPMRTMSSPWVVWACNNNQCLNLNMESINNNRWCLLLNTCSASHTPTLSLSKQACSQTSTCSMSINNPMRTLTFLTINNQSMIYPWTWTIKLTLWRPSRNWPRENSLTSRAQWALPPAYKIWTSTSKTTRVSPNTKT